MRKIAQVTPLDDYCLQLSYTDGEVRLFDVKPYLDGGVFVQLRDVHYFRQVRTFLDSIAWPNGQDFDPDHMYLESVEHKVSSSA